MLHRKSGEEKEFSGVLSIVIPTYNERENLPILVQKIVASLGSIPHEVIVVDDNSPDGTGDVAESLGSQFPITVVRRPGKLGLASAVICGFLKAKGENFCVMDADLSHDPGILPPMVAALNSGFDLVIGSRYVPGGGMKGWPKFREWGSRIAISLARPITPVRDATSGYFALKRSILENVHLDPLGFKIGLEIFVKGNYQRFKEIPYIFTDRQAGKSKLNQKEVSNYLRHLFRLYRWRFLGGSSHKNNAHHNEKNTQPAN